MPLTDAARRYEPGGRMPASDIGATVKCQEPASVEAKLKDASESRNWRPEVVSVKLVGSSSVKTTEKLDEPPPPALGGSTCPDPIHPPTAETPSAVRDEFCRPIPDP